ncbi:hypothetical protein, conserved [Plasmodium ovale]|uniref:PIR protein n=1 Tax=Plasmodium ovale TaxID=36330 RepID=A0A1C3KKY2_PLAOA|nr:hypothetical protein, conserved [Plasmodium ovale]
MEDDKLGILAMKYNYYNFDYKKVECTENYKRVYSYCKIEQKKDKHCEEFHKFFGNKNHEKLSTLSYIQEGTSRRIELLSNKCD